MRARLGVLVVFAVAAAVGGSASSAGALSSHATLTSGNKIYWGANGGDKISEASLDGSGGADLYSGVPSVNTPNGTVLDPATNTMYWVNYSNSTIEAANLDGSGGERTLPIAGSALDGPVGLAIDPTTGKLYWGNLANSTIYEANLDGSDAQLMNTTGATVDQPQGVAIDPLANKIFWVNNDDSKISEAKLDDSGSGHDLTITGTGVTVSLPVGIAVDPTAGKIYWASTGNEEISEANLDGSNATNLTTTGATALDKPSGIAIDPGHNKIYWANKFGNKISYANLDGTGDGGDLTTGAATLGNPNFPALLEAPSGTGLPTIGGGSTADTTLTCSQGSWAVDEVGGFLYRAPQSFSYSWTRNGTPLSGAGQSTLKTTTGGTYSCTVTATNDAGSSTQTSTTVTVSNPPPPPPAPTCKLKAKSKTEKVTASKHGLKLIARCTQAVKGKLTGKVSAVLSNGKHRTFKFTAIKKSLGAGKSVTLTIKLPKKALKALERGGKESASFTLTATNANGTAHATAKIKHVKLKT